MSQKVCDELGAGLRGNTVKFLRKNVLLMDYPEEPKPGDVFRRFDFTKGTAPGSGCPVFAPTLMDGSVINGFLEASFLPWAKDAGYYVVLEPDTGPDLLFTATLDGCAVGYLRALDGAVRVGHHNIQRADGLTDDVAQRESLGYADEAVHRSEYWSKGIKEKSAFTVYKESVAVVCGVRRDGEWRMYVQYLERVQMIPKLNGVRTRTTRIRSAREF
jgi:hypothetical protein